jgi:hypothetical protein
MYWAFFDKQFWTFYGKQLSNMNGPFYPECNMSDQQLWTVWLKQYIPRWFITHVEDFKRRKRCPSTIGFAVLNKKRPLVITVLYPESFAKLTASGGQFSKCEKTNFAYYRVLANFGERDGPVVCYFVGFSACYIAAIVLNTSIRHLLL